MSTALTDQTKMNVENCCVANAADRFPLTRGMIGVETTLSQALEDFASVLTDTGAVDLSLGGDFGSGIIVIGGGAHPELAVPYLEYLKMGSALGICSSGHRHLVHFETPLIIGETVLDGQPTIAPAGPLTSQVATLAKGHISQGHVLDRIGGFDHYG